MSELTKSSPIQNIDDYIDRFKTASKYLAKSLPSKRDSTLRQILPELFNNYFNAVKRSNIELKCYTNCDNWLETYTQIRGDESGAPLMYAWGMLFIKLNLFEWKELERSVELQALLVGIENDVYSYHKESNGENNLQHFITKYYNVDSDTAFKKVLKIRQEVLEEYNNIKKQMVNHPNDNVKAHVQTGLPGWLEGGGFWQSKISRRYVFKESMNSNFKAFNIFHPDHTQKNEETVSSSITKDVKEWVNKVGLLSPEIFPEKKFDALDVGEAVLHMYKGYMNNYQSQIAYDYTDELIWIAKFLAWIYIVDDTIEKEATYEVMTRAVTESFVNEL